jgi:hypothetical protein
VIVKIGNKIFYENYVSFHLHRASIYSPWQVIGVYLAYHKDARCRYAREYRYMEAEFYREVDRAGDLAGTYEFLDGWRKKHIELNSVMTKVIRFCTQSNDYCSHIHDLGEAYVGRTDPQYMGKIAVMLKSPKRFYPVVFAFMKQHREVLELLRKAKEI